MTIVGISGQISSGKDTVSDYLCDEHGFQKIALADPIKRFGKHVFGFDDTQLWGPSSGRNAFDTRYTRCEIRSSGVKFTPKTKLTGLRKVCDPYWARAARNLLAYGPEWLHSIGLSDEDEQYLMETLCDWFASLGHKYPELSPRIMLQSLGTEWGREAVDSTVWINTFLKNADKVLRGFPYSKDNGIDLCSSQNYFPAGVVCSDVRFSNELTEIKKAKGKLIRVIRPETDAKASKTGIENHRSETEQQGFSSEQFDAVLSNKGTLEELYEAVDALVPKLKQNR